LREVIKRAYAAAQSSAPEWDGNFSRVFYPYD